MSFQEITGMEGSIITMQEIFAFEQTGIGQDGMVRGRFRGMGIMPRFIEKFKVLSIPVPYDFFNSENIQEI